MRDEEETEFRKVCKARSRAAPYGDCHAQAVWTADVCPSHGGRTPGVTEAGTRRWAEGEMRRIVRSYGGPITIEPTEALMNEIYRTYGHIYWLGEMVTKNLPNELAEQFWQYRRSTEVPTGFKETVQTNASHAYAGVWLDLYMKERAHLVKSCQVAISLGLEERRVQLSERVAEALATAVSDLARDFGKDPDDPIVRDRIFFRLSQAGAVMALTQGGDGTYSNDPT
jgi:hypothetical protein